MNINQSKSKFKTSDTIFATGVFLKPVKCVVNDIEQWRWIAISFEDDNYFDGNVIKTYEYSDTFEGLFIEDEE